MKNSYGNNIKKIVELNPLCESFYQYFVKKNSNRDYECVLLRNLILQYIETISFYIEDIISLSFSVEYDEQEENLKVVYHCPEKKIKIESNCTKEGLFRFFSELTHTVLDDKFYTSFCEDEVHEAFKKYINDLWNYYQNYNNTVSSYKLGSKDTQFTSYINLLLQDTDSGLLLIEQLNFLIYLFNNICQSLLKGEYLIYDDFAKEYLTKAVTYSSIETKRTAIITLEENNLQNQDSNTSAQNEAEEILEEEKEETSQGDNNNQEEKVEPEPCVEKDEKNELEYFKDDLLSFFSSKCTFFNIDKKDENHQFLSKVLLSSFIDLYRESKITPFIHYMNVNNMLADYSIFIEKIKKYTEIKQRQHLFNIEKYEQTDYENNVSLCVNTLPLANTVTALGKIMQYIFHLILDMCLIDHNYISTDKNLIVLLRLHCILQLNSQQSPNNYSFFMVLDSLKKRTLINKKNIEELENTIKLVGIKNDLLLLKMRKRSGYSLKDIVYHAIIPEQVENIHEKPYYLFLPPSQFLPDIKQNIIYERYIALLEKNCENIEKHLKGYEQIFTEIICKNELDYEIKYKQLTQALEKPLYAILGSCNEKIFAYNNVIYFNFKNHFIKYGRYIKKLKIEIKEKRNDDYLKEITEFIEANKESEMISCAFILKHLEWLDKVMKDDILCSGKESHELIIGFEYIRLAEILLNSLQMLIKKLESDSYCMNYSSFFQDCFFQKNGEKVERMIIKDPTQLGFDPENNDSKNIFFLSSIWQPPVSLNILKIKYEHYTERVKLNATFFYQIYITTMEETQNHSIKNKVDDIKNRIEANEKSIIERMHELLTENKKDTVQILGVFAAFLAIATVGLGNLSGDKNNPINIQDRVISICACFGYFILLLQLLTTRKIRENLTIYILLIIIIFFLTIIFISGLN